MNKEIIPEFLQEQCNPESLSSGLKKLFVQDFRKRQIIRYNEAIKALVPKKGMAPSKSAAISIIKIL
jgi:lipid A disaccharide synthetase